MKWKLIFYILLYLKFWTREEIAPESTFIEMETDVLIFGSLKKPPGSIHPPIINNIFNFPSHRTEFWGEPRLYLFCFCDGDRVRLLMLLGKGGSDLSCPGDVTVCLVSIFSHLFLSSNTTVSRPTITSPLRSLCCSLLSSSGLSLTAFLPQRGSVWPSLCLGWRAGRLERLVIISGDQPSQTNTMLPSSLATILHLSFITAVIIINTNICMLPSVCNLYQHKAVDYFQGETKGILHSRSK